MRLRLCLIAIPLVVALSSCSLGGAGSSEPAHVAAPRHPPVVMIVFDEFSTISLLDAKGEIDPIRDPNFAALAHDGNWFPYATASLDETGRAMRSMFTGETQWKYAAPTYADNPRNLFVLLGRRYRIYDGEETSNFCPPRLCPDVPRPTKHRILHELGGGRPERLAGWLRSVHSSSRPTFYVKHVLLPHAPWVYLPNGDRYANGASEAALSWDLWHYNRWLVDQDYQRHLLQVEFTDRLLGRILAKLRATGLYDRSLVVVTADNGESFGRLGNGHEISGQNAADIALTPLLIKLPFQREGRIVRRHVRTVDVLPTIADVTHMRVGWPVEGHSVFGPGAARIPRASVMIERSGQRLRLGLGELRRRAAAALRRKLKLFGSGDGAPGLFGIGPYPRLRGTPVSRWPLLAPRGTRAVVDGAAAYGRVKLGSGAAPVKVSGLLSGSGSRSALDVAVAINGTIAATAPTVAPKPGARRLFSLVIPEQALHDGSNLVEVFAIRPRGGELPLEPLQQAG
jgi:Sulfatase